MAIQTYSIDEAATLVEEAAKKSGIDPITAVQFFKQQNAGTETVRWEGNGAKIASSIAQASSASASKASASSASSGNRAYNSTSVSSRGTPEQRADLIAATQATSDNLAPLIQAYESSSTSTVNSLANLGISVGNAGRAKAVQTFVESGADTERINKQNEINSIFGVSVSGGKSAVIQELAARAEEARIKRQGVEDKINANNSVDPLAKPLSWLLGQVHNTVLEPQYGSLSAIESAATKTLKDRQELAASQTRIEPAIAASTAAQLQIAKTATMATAARADEDTAIANSRKLETGLLLERMKVAGLPLDIQQSTFKLLAEQERFSSGQGGAGSLKTEQEQYLDMINAARAQYNVGPLNMVTLKLLPKESADVWQRLATGAAVGDTPGEVIANLKAAGIGPEQYTSTKGGAAGVAYQKLMQSGSEHLQELTNLSMSTNPAKAAEAKAALKLLKTPGDTIKAGIDGYIAQAQDEVQRKGHGGVSKDNPYKLQLGEAAAGAGLPRENAVVDIVISSGGKKNPMFGDAEVVGSLVGRARADLKSIPKLAKEAAAFYSSGIDEQFTRNGYGTFGIKKFDDYTVPVGNGKRVNMLDPQAIETHLITQVTNAVMPFQTPAIVTPEGEGRVKKFPTPSGSFNLFN